MFLTPWHQLVGLASVIAVLSIGLTSAVVIPSDSHRINVKDQPFRPVVLWHGMGDTCCEASMNGIRNILEESMPGVYVYSIKIGEDKDADRKAGYFGVITEQIAGVCTELTANPSLAKGFNAIGFSQGGQFLRGLAETCETINIINLITMGAQHAGISKAPGCASSMDWNCRLMDSLLAQGAYLPFVQNRVIQAQYFRDSRNYASYLEGNIFLPWINNEIYGSRNETYKKNLNKLENLVLMMFAADTTVVPKESGWFGFIDELGAVIPIFQQDLYKEDWLGLKAMYESGRLHLDEIPGEHMQITPKDFKSLVIDKYLIHKTPNMRIQ